LFLAELPIKYAIFFLPQSDAAETIAAGIAVLTKVALAAVTAIGAIG
jgi:hypothetical protein